MLLAQQVYTVVEEVVVEVDHPTQQIRQQVDLAVVDMVVLVLQVILLIFLVVQELTTLVVAVVVAVLDQDKEILVETVVKVLSLSDT
jgi:uncharacterized membrane protein